MEYIYIFQILHYFIKPNVPPVGRQNIIISPVQFRLVAQSCLTLCDPMDCSMPGLPVHHQLLEFTQTRVH